MRMCFVHMCLCLCALCACVPHVPVPVPVSVFVSMLQCVLQTPATARAVAPTGPQRPTDTTGHWAAPLLSLSLSLSLALSSPLSLFHLSLAPCISPALLPPAPLQHCFTGPNEV